MKTAISIPDEIFEQATQAAKRLGLSRSELFTRAMKAFLRTRLEANITESYNAAFADGDDTELSDFRRRATRNPLLEVEWSEE